MAEVRHTPFTDSSPSHIFLECLLSLFVPLGPIHLFPFHSVFATSLCWSHFVVL